MTSQITVRARDCLVRPNRRALIGDALAYRGREWVIVGLFWGADPITSEAEEYLVLETRHAVMDEGGEERGRVG